MMLMPIERAADAAVSVVNLTEMPAQAEQPFSDDLGRHESNKDKI
jgi:hypothetical protein